VVFFAFLASSTQQEKQISEMVAPIGHRRP
jgi:hypothetical protein